MDEIISLYYKYIEELQETLPQEEVKELLNEFGNYLTHCSNCLKRPCSDCQIKEKVEELQDKLRNIFATQQNELIYHGKPLNSPEFVWHFILRKVAYRCINVFSKHLYQKESKFISTLRDKEFIKIKDIIELTDKLNEILNKYREEIIDDLLYSKLAQENKILTSQDTELLFICFLLTDDQKVIFRQMWVIGNEEKIISENEIKEKADNVKSELGLKGERILFRIKSKGILKLEGKRGIGIFFQPTLLDDLNNLLQNFWEPIVCGRIRRPYRVISLENAKELICSGIIYSNALSERGRI